MTCLHPHARFVAELAFGHVKNLIGSVATRGLPSVIAIETWRRRANPTPKELYTLETDRAAVLRAYRELVSTIIRSDNDLTEYLMDLLHPEEDGCEVLEKARSAVLSRAWRTHTQYNTEWANILPHTREAALRMAGVAS